MSSRRSDVLIITALVAAHFGLAVRKLLSADRHRPVVMARSIAMALTRQELHMSYPQIGRAFGIAGTPRHHTSCMWSIKAATSQFRIHIETLAPMVRKALKER